MGIRLLTVRPQTMIVQRFYSRSPPPLLSPSSSLVLVALWIVVVTTLTVLAALAVKSTSAMSIASRTGSRISVAVLGSGISGSTAARALADYGLQVTLFEAGRGIGGRTSTRVVISNKSDSDGEAGDGYKRSYQFDHGAQYIGSPKTERFRAALDEWIQNGWVKPWHGRFANEQRHPAAAAAAADDGTGCGETSTIIVAEDPSSTSTSTPSEKYVGSPSMDSICRGLLDHENIEVVLRTRADARFESSGSSSSSRRRWNLFSTNTNGSSSEELSLGSFDWLVSSDRLSIGDHRRDLPKDVLKTFYGKTQAVQSIKCLVAMVVFESSLDIPYDGVRFIGHDGTTTSTARYGSLGWVCRDTSKPGRQQRRDGDCVDGHECWVLQSHPTAAEQILNSMSPDSTIDDIRQRAKDVLMEDFMNAIPSLATTTTTGNIPVPRMIESIGHRWGAAFPLVVVDDDDRSTLLDEEFYIDTSTNFVSCGDYYGGGRKLTGRIEGAYLSGMSAASQLIEYLETKKKS